MYVVSLLLVAGLTLTQVENGGTDALRLEVMRLVRQLDDDELAQRNAAEEALIELGPAAMELLPPVTRNTSAEVKVRLGRVVKALQLAQAKAASRASTVTLSGTMNLSEALQRLERQTGNKIIDFRQRFGQPATDPQVTVSFQDTPFWQAIDRILDQAGMTVYHYSGQEGVVAIVASQNQAPRVGRAAYSGLFRFEVVELIAKRSLRNPQTSSLQLNLEVAWEPRLKPIVLHVPLGETQAVGSDGATIPISTPEARPEIPVETTIPASELTVPLVLPDRSVRKIDSLKGRLIALVPGQVETFVFDDLENARQVDQKKAGVTVELEEIRKNNELYEFRVRVQFDEAGDALDSHRNWVYNNEAYLVDANGKKMENVGMQAFQQTRDEVGVAYLFDAENGLANWKFAYRTPVVIINMPIEYQLKDLELP